MDDRRLHQREREGGGRAATESAQSSVLSPQSSFYRSLGHEDCYERLTLAIRRGQGLSVVIGEAGYGKTTIKETLLAEIGQEPGVVIGTIDDPHDCRTDVQFLRAVLGEFGVEANGRTGLDLTTAFLGYLEGLRATRQMALLVIDEGHHLTSSHLEILRTFLSGEGPTRAPLAIVLFAEPELEEKIGRKRNLARRVGMEHRLNPLNRRDSAGLIAHRFGKTTFADEAIDLIHERAGGVPGAVVALSDGCLREARRRGWEQVDGALASAVVDHRARRNGDVDGATQLQFRVELPAAFAGEAAP